MAYPTALEIDVTIYEDNEKLALALEQMQAIRRLKLFKKSPTQIYFIHTEKLSTARLAAVQALVSSYADFAFIGNAPQRQGKGLIARLINAESDTPPTVDGALQIAVQPETKGSILGRSILASLKAYLLLLQKDGFLDARRLTAEDITATIETLYNNGSAEHANKESISKIFQGVDWLLMVRYRILPALKALINQIRVIANLRKQAESMA